MIGTASATAMGQASTTSANNGSVAIGGDANGTNITIQTSASPNSDAVAKARAAVDLLKVLCVDGGSRVNIQARGNGSLRIDDQSGEMKNGAIVVQKEELEGFQAGLSQLEASQAASVRECMKPQIEKIISAVISGVSTPNGPKDVTIHTDGGYFVLEEFDKIMSAAASSDDGSTLVISLSSNTKFSIPKIRYYLYIAEKNEMGTFSESIGIFKCNKKCTNYVASRGLLN